MTDNSILFVSFIVRFEQERGFKGTDRGATREGPVQFQREADPFDLTDFFKDVRQGGGGGGSSAPSANSSSKRANPNEREERTSEKRRKNK